MAWLETQFCRSTGPIRAHIYAQFGLIYSHLGCVKLLHRLGFEYRKPKALPRVADEVKQADFIDFYESLLNTLPADEAVYFADAVNREYQSKPAFGWVKKGSNPAVKTTPGRGRVNIHGALCLENFDALGNLTRFLLLPGQAHDMKGVALLIKGISFGALLADKAFDADWLLAELDDRGAAAIIPPKSNQKHQRDYDKDAYRWRHLVENSFAKIKECRGIATRYDKTDSSYAAS